MNSTMQTERFNYLKELAYSYKAIYEIAKLLKVSKRNVRREFEKYGFNYDDILERAKEARKTNIKKTYANPELRKRISENSKRKWNEPEYREKTLNAIKKAIPAKTYKPKVVKEMTEEVDIKKIYNLSLGKSIIEQEIAKVLKDNFPDVQTDVEVEDIGTFNFYIPNKDLYIWYHGEWIHGYKVYEDTEEDKELIKKYKKALELNYRNKVNYNLYVSAIKTFTEIDPEKRKIANEKGLNWVEFFNFDSFKSWFENNCK